MLRLSKCLTRLLNCSADKKGSSNQGQTGRSLTQIFRRFATKTQLRDSETSFVPQVIVLCHTKQEQCSNLSAQIELERAEYSKFPALTDEESPI